VVAIIPAESANKESPEKGVSFRWKYIILPLSILLLSIILAAYFYRLLPDDVAYHFKGGSPDRLMSRATAIAWMVLPQFIFVLMSAFIVWGTRKLSARFQQAESAVVKQLLLLMGNMLALPQLILSFAMLDIFSYNAYQTHIMPLWTFALIIMVSGGIVLGIYFLSIIRRVLRPQSAAPGKSYRERE
jgi:uncharacterized membrane protein